MTTVPEPQDRDPERGLRRPAWPRHAMQPHRSPPRVPTPRPRRLPCGRALAGTVGLGPGGFPRPQRPSSHVSARGSLSPGSPAGGRLPSRGFSQGDLDVPSMEGRDFPPVSLELGCSI